ncbi:MAG: hypothetical protein RBS76_02025 [Acholeplasmatales bacterium]|jgi:hypothetical protein|nr:hypothetical protein [Acholeplasmataceae bacterium]MCK9233626.1 hypothetical protein [Acholeplasmataceae bacterium]MCK9289475.1 hypothetical protein [Acholeplasmataceae bacterium]MCK9427910.1 hypothetical protein [Acholeplasmataceae bacterium]MDY0115259.1 hypothetical protein [Acholeplasmatales bacterium]
MKKLFYPLIILFIIVLMVINYLSYQAPKTKKFITQNKVYTNLNGEPLFVDIYCNHKSAYHQKEAFDEIFLKDDKGDNKWLLNLDDIFKKESYSYLKESFNCYLYCFTLPKLTIDVEMEEAYLVLKLKNGEELKLLIGSFNYYYQDNNNLNLIECFATKKDNLLELETVNLKFSLEEEFTITKLKIGSRSFNYQKTVSAEEIVSLEIPPLLKIVDALSLKLTYQIGTREYHEVLPYFVFFENFENPLSFSILNNVYTVN